jgi:hypothetical protein
MAYRSGGVRYLTDEEAREVKNRERIAGGRVIFCKLRGLDPRHQAWMVNRYSMADARDLEVFGFDPKAPGGEKRSREPKESSDPEEYGGGSPFRCEARPQTPKPRPNYCATIRASRGAA